MTTRPTPRALNRPLLIAGIERRLLGAALIVSVVVAANAKITPLIEFMVGATVFTLTITAAKILTRKDDRIFNWAWSVWKQKAVYDPHVREL